MNLAAALFFCLAAILMYLWWRGRKRLAIIQASRHHLIQERQRVFGFLQDVGEAFTENLRLEEILKLVTQCSVRTAEARSGAIFLIDSSEEHLEAVVIEGPFPPPIKPSDFMESKLASRSIFLEQTIKSRKIALGEGILGQVAETGKPILIRSPDADSRLPRYEDPTLNIKTFLAVPLLFRDQIFGVMAMANTLNNKSFDETDLSLVTSLAVQGAFAIYNANLHYVMAERERLDRDLEIAREIQRLLLPSSFPTIPGVQVCALNTSAQKVGGDYYDFIQVDSQHWGFAIADVSGKGVSGALIMAMCRSALRSNALGNLSPSDVLKKVNRTIHPDMREDMFISMTYGILDLQHKTFSFCRAGHEPLIRRSKEKRCEEEYSPKGMALGFDNGTTFDKMLEEKTIALQEGDALVFYTDGITEALDDQGQEFGRTRLIEAIHDSAERSAEQMTRDIEERVRRFAGHQPQNDDITLLVIRT